MMTIENSARQGRDKMNKSDQVAVLKKLIAEKEKLLKNPSDYKSLLKPCTLAKAVMVYQSVHRVSKLPKKHWQHGGQVR